MTSRSRTWEWLDSLGSLMLALVCWVFAWLIFIPFCWILDKLGYEIDKGDE